MKIFSILLKVLAVIWTIFWGSVFFMESSDVTMIAMATVLTLPTIIYLIVSSKVFKDLKAKNPKVTTKRATLACIALAILGNLGANLIDTAKLTGISVSMLDTDMNLAYYDEAEDNYASGRIDLRFTAKGRGSYYFSPTVTIKNTSDENHPYYGEGITAQMDNGRVYVDKLTNGTYQLQVTAFEGDTSGKSPSAVEKMAYTVTTDFEVTEGYNSKEEFLTAYEGYQAEKNLAYEKSQEEKQALIDAMPSLVNYPVEQGNCYVNVEHDGTYDTDTGKNYEDVGHFVHNSDYFICGKKTHVNDNDQFKVASISSNGKFLNIDANPPYTKVDLTVKPCEECFNYYNYLQYK